MDGDSCRSAEETLQVPDQVIGGGSVTDGGMEGGDWRTTLQQDTRQRIVNKIMETLKRHLPFTGQEGLQELKKIAVRFEEKIYTGATSQSDYLRKISLKMLTTETKSQNPMANSLESNAATNGENPHDPDSSSQIGSAIDEDWQEEIYQKIKSMHGMYYPELNDMYQRMAARLQQHDDARPHQPRNEPLEKLRFLKLMLERLIMFLQTKKNDILPNHKDKIGGVEKQIVNILNSNRPRKAISSMQQGQLPQPHMHAMQQPQVSQTHTNEVQMNSQMQQMNILGSSLPTQQNNSTILQQNTITSGSNISDSDRNDVVMKQNPLGGSPPMTTSSVTSTNGQLNANSLESISSILRQQEYQQWQYQQLQRQQQMQGEQIVQQQQLIQQFMQQQQQTSQGQPAQLHAQQQHMQSQHSLLQQMPSLPQKEQPLQPQKTSPLQSGLAQHMQVVLQQLQLQQTSQQHSRQVTGQQPVMPQELVVIHQQFTGQDLEKQLLIPKHQTSQKQPGDPIVFFILVFSLLILLLVKFFLLEVFRTHQLSSE